MRFIKSDYDTDDVVAELLGLHNKTNVTIQDKKKK